MYGVYHTLGALSGIILDCHCHVEVELHVVLRHVLLKVRGDELLSDILAVKIVALVVDILVL